MSNNTSHSDHYKWNSIANITPIEIYNGMDEIINNNRTCQCDTPLAMTRPILSTAQNTVACTSWCPFCGATEHVTVDSKMFPHKASADVWRLDADKIYGFIASLNAFGYLPKDAESGELTWTFPQMYSDGTFSINVFNIAVGRGLTVRAPECYILRDDLLTNFDKKLLEEFDQLGSLGLIFPKEPAYANA